MMYPHISGVVIDMDFFFLAIVILLIFDIKYSKPSLFLLSSSIFIFITNEGQ